MGAVRTASQKTTPTVTNKAATADPTTNRTETLGVGTDSPMTLTAINKVAMVDPTTNHTGTPRADTDNPITLPATKKAPMVDPITNRTKTPRATMDDRATPTGAAKAVTVDRTTTATVDRKIPTEATPPVAAGRVATLTEAVRGALENLTITTMVLTANRRNAAVVRGCTRRFRNVR